jgi:hypothetical protein
LISLMAATVSLEAKRKDDVLILENGDRMTGEVKKLTRGELYFNTGYFAQDVRIDWTKVSRLVSLDRYQIILSNGRQLVGEIERSMDGVFSVAGMPLPAPLGWRDVVSMLPVERKFWNQLTGNLDYGFDYTSGNDQTQSTLTSALGYIAYRYSLQLSGSSVFSGQTDGTNTSRNTFDALAQYRFRRKWFAVAVLDLLTSEQQDLDLRTTSGAGVAWALVQTDRTEFRALFGIVASREKYTVAADGTSQPPSTNLEAVVAANFSMFRFKTTQIDMNLAIYPNLSTAGRVRLSAKPNLQLELVRNLYWSFYLYENYDSKPPVEAPRNDFGVTSSFGWKF